MFGVVTQHFIEASDMLFLFYFFSVSVGLPQQQIIGLFTYRELESIFYKRYGAVDTVAAA